MPVWEAKTLSLQSTPPKEGHFRVFSSNFISFHLLQLPGYTLACKYSKAVHTSRDHVQHVFSWPSSSMLARLTESDRSGQTGQMKGTRRVDIMDRQDGRMGWMDGMDALDRKIEFVKHIARIAKAALHNLPGKSSWNARAAKMNSSPRKIFELWGQKVRTRPSKEVKQSRRIGFLGCESPRGQRPPCISLSWATNVATWNDQSMPYFESKVLWE